MSLTINWNKLPHQDKFDALFNRFKQLGCVITAYSGGVDSTLLMKVGSIALGDDCIGVIVNSGLFSLEEYDAALSLAKKHCFHLHSLYYPVLQLQHVSENTQERCYYCKREVFTRLTQFAHENNVPYVLEGSNADDLTEHRPGMRAISELNILSPLCEVGLHKHEIRELARALKLSNWDKPSVPCLATRLPYGTSLDSYKLSQIAKAEQFMHTLGFRVVRVRHHGVLASIEVPLEDFDGLLQTRSKVIDFLKSVGFTYVTLDLMGFRSGSMDESES